MLSPDTTFIGSVREHKQALTRVFDTHPGDGKAMLANKSGNEPDPVADGMINLMPVWIPFCPDSILDFVGADRLRVL